MTTRVSTRDENESPENTRHPLGKKNYTGAVIKFQQFCALQQDFSLTPPLKSAVPIDWRRSRTFYQHVIRVDHILRLRWVMQIRYAAFPSLFIGLLTVFVGAPFNRADAEALTVVELFTSQGCSSCPPADRIIGDLTKEKNILPLSFNVDYWNYIGWKDPFSSPEKTQRQRDYARKLGLRHIYTPQVVINGRDEEVGSRRALVLDKIKKAAQVPRVPIAFNGGMSDSIPLTVTIESALLTSVVPADVLLVIFDRKKETDIRRGENAGRKLAYHNVVSSFERIGQWSGESLTLSLDRTRLAMDGEGCAVLLQMADTGEILGAASLSLR